MICLLTQVEPTKGDSRDMRSSNPNQPTSSERVPFWVKPAVIAGIGIAALTGCTPTHATGPETTQSATAIPSPEATEVPAVDRYEGADFERTDPLPAELEAADQATPEEFAQLPKAEQIKWATWAGQYKDEFVAYFSAVSGLPQDAPYTIDANSDAKALLIDRSFQQRIAANFGEGTPTDMDSNGVLDRDVVEKYMTAFTVASEESQAKIENFLSTAPNSKGQAINVVQQARGGLYDTSAQIAESQDFTSITNSMVIDGQTITGFRVSWTAADGSSSSSFNIGAFSTVDYKNQPVVVAVVSH